MSYFRRAIKRPMGDDGPITHPWQVDESIIAIVPPTRVDCAQLPADSPWRQPGQVCAPSSLLDSAISMVKDVALGPAMSVDYTNKAGETSGFDIPGWLVYGGLGAVALHLWKRKKR